MAPQFGQKPAGEHLSEISRSVNYDLKSAQFVNLVETMMDMDGPKLMGVMYDWLFNTKGRVPKQSLPSNFSLENQPVDTSAYITWFGHSAVYLEIEGKKLLIDPMLGNYASPVPFMTRRFSYQNDIVLDQIPEVDAVIISHDHYDHLDHTSIKALKDRVGHFYVPLGVASHLWRWGVPKDKITEMDWWQETEFKGIKLACTPARHFSGRALNDRNSTLWASWVIIGQHNRIYFSGDGGYFPGFKDIGEVYGPFDFTMMECGQYNERWAAIHMMPEETVQAHIDVKGEVMMPIHWSAFNLALHTWTEPAERAQNEAERKGVKMFTPKIGERNLISSDMSTSHWWKSMQ